MTGVAKARLVQPLLGLALAVVATLAAATPLQPPAEVAAAIPEARLVGQGTLRWLGLPVYEARLWAGSGFDATRVAEETFALELRYARRLESAAIAERSLDEMRRGGPIAEADAAAWRSSLRAAFPDVAPGDRLTGLHHPAEGARFFFNGRFTSAIADRHFAQRFYAIWLGPHTSQPGLRSRLLGSQP